MTTERDKRTAVASMRCGDCGKIVTQETTLSGILDFIDRTEAAGWTFNARGFVCCPECAPLNGAEEPEAKL
jgi:hypothetical protein